MRRDVDRLAAQRFDITVVGGGIHGAWIALRAACAGYTVALVERGDFGAATSANSLKILHGGLRYLQHLDLRRMRDSVRARRELSRLAPHLVRPLPCLLPLAASGVRSPWVLGPALTANDFVSWDRNSGLPPEVRLPRGRLIGGRSCRSRIGPVAESEAFAGALWWDAITLDAPRLTLEVLIEAAAYGAAVVNRVEALDLLLERGAICGLTVSDRLTGRRFEVSSSVVIDAAGPWAGSLSAARGLPTAFLPPAWVGAMNIVLRRSLGLDAAVALSAVSKAADTSAVLRRATREIFVVPWNGAALIGTDYVRLTDRGHEDPPVPADAVRRFLAELDEVMPRARLVEDDVARVHWGRLPLERADDELPRKTPVIAAGAEQTGAAGLAVVIGEKLTSAPAVSERVMRAVAAMLPRRPRRDGRPDAGAGSDAAPAASTSAAVRLASRYGRRWPRVAAHAADRPGLLDPVHPSSNVLGAEVVHAIREEMALDLEDLVVRRLGLGDTGEPRPDVVERCAKIAAEEWGWDANAKASAVRKLYAAGRGARSSSGSLLEASFRR